MFRLYVIMEQQKELIHNTKWDLLIILDACRYDYFKEECKIKGKLKKVISSGKCTTYWLLNTWTGFYDDIHYISANPYISKYIPPNGWDTFKHFNSIDKVWEWGWDDTIGTVHPEKVVNAVKNYTGGRRIIAHFMQPHYPYINKIYIPIRSDRERRTSLLAEGKDTNIKTTGILYCQAISQFGEDKIREAYRNNLRLVLEYVEKLIESIDNRKKIIITADHGELLGENGKWGHPHDGPELLREVPWFEPEL